MDTTTTQITAHSALTGRRDSPIVGVILAVLLHVGIIGAAWYFGRDTGPRLVLDKPIQAHLVRLGEKRDQKLLPRKEANMPPPEPEPVVASSKPTPAAVTPPKPPPPKAAQKPPKDLKKDLFAAFDKTKPISKPDVLSGDVNGDREGDVDTASEGERYFGLISSRVKHNYDVSSAIPDAERIKLVAVVVIHLDGTGRVTRTELETKSGNALFDAAVLSAVKKASPFPPPPDFLRESLGHEGAALKFRP